MANAQTPAEKSVQFINAEVLAPPKQDSISFVKPYVEQTLAMALEDARSFLQGAEQILLIALAKELEKLISGGAPAAFDPALMANLRSAAETGGVEEAGARRDAAAKPNMPGPHAAPHQPATPPVGLKAIESVMASLSAFHASIADTALNSKRER